jgi:dipeptidyl aminopeptidase/acylaminoacyl peptidase
MTCRDIRHTALYQEAEALFRTCRLPGTGLVSDAVELHAAPGGKHAVFAGLMMDKLEGTPSTRICEVDLASGEMIVLSAGPNVDRWPKYSPSGRHIGFLSDRHQAGDFQLYLLDRASGAVQAAPKVAGWVEYLHWSADGSQILLGVAAHGADVAGREGAVTSERAADDLPSWMPTIAPGDESHQRRSVWIYDVASGQLRRVDHDCNVWEAVWCGSHALLAVASAGAAEGLWYDAKLHVIDVYTGASREIFTPEYQMGVPAASPSGRRVAIVSSVCSDRGIVAGDLLLMNADGSQRLHVDTSGVDVACLEWLSDERLLLAGHRGFDTVVGVCDGSTGEFNETWSSRELTTAGTYATVSALNATGDCVCVGEGFVRSPEIATIQRGDYRAVRSLEAGFAERSDVLQSAEPVRWTAADGLEIQGWLLRPRDTGPQPLVMAVHGGPVYHWRPNWLGRRGIFALLLLQRGFAVLLPNPRGSSGRGQTFARKVLGDVAGGDARDCLAGLDHLIRDGSIDPSRLGVTGASYGGYMTAWLITQDQRFSAAVTVAPVSNKVSQHLLSNIPNYVALFVGDHYTNPGGKYFERSPIMHAHKAATPTLNICGALDRCTPPEEARQFHNALLENGVESELLTYPEEGHGIRNLPAVIDYTARMIGWLAVHMSGAAENSR